MPPGYSEPGSPHSEEDFVPYFFFICLRPLSLLGVSQTKRIGGHDHHDSYSSKASITISRFFIFPVLWVSESSWGCFFGAKIIIVFLYGCVRGALYEESIGGWIRIPKELHAGEREIRLSSFYLDCLVIIPIIPWRYQKAFRHFCQYRQSPQ